MSVAYKEISELLDAALLALDDYKELMADGKIDFRDFTTLLKISRQLSVFNAAVQGLNQLSLAALAQMSNDEIQALVAKVMQLLAGVGVQLKV